MKLFICCLALCAVGIVQAQVQDTPETVAAKAAHFEAVRRAEALIASAPAPVVIRSHQQQSNVVETSQHTLGLNVQDTPEVAAAKAVHYEAVREAELATAIANSTGRVPDPKSLNVVPVPYSSGGHHSHSGHYSQPHSGHYSQHSYYPTPSHTVHHHHHNPAPTRPSHHHHHHHNPVPARPTYDQYNHYNPPAYNHHQHQIRPVPYTSQHQLGVVVHDTPEVAAAKAAHFDAYSRAAQAAAVSGPQDDGSYVMIPEPAPIVPVAPVVHGGVHLRDTPEVAAAKAAHFEALRRAQMSAGSQYAQETGYHMPQQVVHMPMPVMYHQTIEYNSQMYPNTAVPQTNQHKLGVIVQDTPEVAAAKAAHLEAFRRAQRIAAENENKYQTGFIPSNNYFTNPTRQYGQVEY